MAHMPVHLTSNNFKKKHLKKSVNLFHARTRAHTHTHTLAKDTLTA